MSFDALLRRARSGRVVELGPDSRPLALRGEALHPLLPHRDPFLLVDSIVRFDPARRSAEGRRRVDPGDPVLAGHFPGAPVYPGVLLVEMLGQLGLATNALCLREADPAAAPGAPRLMKIHQAIFSRAVRPGEELTLLAQVLEDGDYTVPCLGQALVQGEVAAAALLEVLYVDEEER